MSPSHGGHLDGQPKPVEVDMALSLDAGHVQEMAMSRSKAVTSALVKVEAIGE